MDPEDVEFDRQSGRLKDAVDVRVASEQIEEFPAVVEFCDLDRRRMGRRLEAMEQAGPGLGSAAR